VAGILAFQCACPISMSRQYFRVPVAIIMTNAFRPNVVARCLGPGKMAEKNCADNATAKNHGHGNGFSSTPSVGVDLSAPEVSAWPLLSVAI
jgi:hypothetical protein